jgi:hypothetical protein
MGYTTYENVANPHVTIHSDGCGQIKKRGGEHKYRQGSYRHHDSYREAEAYARTTGLPIKNCSFCKPS